jgi:hypothetical protein
MMMNDKWKRVGPRRRRRGSRVERGVEREEEER